MKCPSCAEEIKEEAKKCWRCSEPINDAVRKGYPYFYSHVLTFGFDYDSLMLDYGNHLYPDEGFGDCCFSAKNSLLNIDNEIGEDEELKTYHRQKLKRFRDAMADRWTELPDNSPERHALVQMSNYLQLIGEFLKFREYEEENPLLSHEKLSWYPGGFGRLKASLGNIDGKLRSDLEERIDLAIKWCEGHLAIISPARPVEKPAVRHVSTPNESRATDPSKSPPEPRHTADHTISYNLVGADQKVYGPVTDAEVCQWISEGRADTETLVQDQSVTIWKPLKEFPEFQVALNARKQSGFDKQEAERFSSEPSQRAGASIKGMAAAQTATATGQFNPKLVNWLDTLQLNAVRAGTVSLTLLILLLFVGAGAGAFSVLFLFPLIYFAGFVPFEMVVRLAPRWKNGVLPKISRWLSGTMLLGDPLMYGLQKLDLKYSLIKTVPLFKLSLVSWVLKTDEKQFQPNIPVTSTPTSPVNLAISSPVIKAETRAYLRNEAEMLYQKGAQLILEGMRDKSNNTVCDGLEALVQANEAAPDFLDPWKLYCRVLYGRLNGEQLEKFLFVEKVGSESNPARLAFLANLVNHGTFDATRLAEELQTIVRPRGKSTLKA